MAGTVEQKLAAQGIVLNEPRTPMANYVGFVRTGNLLFVSGQVCATAEGKLIAKGKLGAGVTIEQGYAAAQGCGVNLLAQVKAALRRLDKVVRVVRLGGFINSAPDFRRTQGAQRRVRPDGRSRRQGPARPHHRRRCLLPRTPPSRLTRSSKFLSGASQCVHRTG
jgi:enamine deaminase RidA (YjgF/YER057c/UK114 family)